MADGRCYRIDVESKPSGYADVYVDDEFIERFTGKDAISKAAKKIEEMQKKDHQENITWFNF